MYGVAFGSLLLSQPVIGAPQGGEIVAGHGEITKNNTKTDIIQNTDRMIIKWDKFDVHASEHVQFHQPTSSSIALNKIYDTKASQIDGRITANGHVMLINPNGIVFGGGSVVDVGALTATTADIDTDNFMNERYLFDQPGDVNAAIINNGLITAREAGLVNIVAPQVHNNGVIRARLGKIQMAAADTFAIDMAGDGLIQIAVSDDTAQKLAHNSGLLSAEGGYVAMTAGGARNILDSITENSGIIEAQSLSQKGGKIILGGGDTGVTLNRGIVDASGRKNETQGGEIAVLGQHVGLMEGSFIDASGTAEQAVDMSDESAAITADGEVKTNAEFLNSDRRGGGSIMIGGDYLGSGDTPTAQTLYVDAGAITLNDAITHGDGGRTVFWSDVTTDFSGQVYARGGTLSGHGGFVETSGKENLRAAGFVDLRNRVDGYNKGTYFLDPNAITIYGNVDEDYVSTDSSVDLTANEVLDLDFTAFENILEAGTATTSTFASLAVIASGDTNRTGDVTFSANVTIPASPIGAIFEQGGTGTGAWVGFLADGTFVVHAGGGGSFAATNAAHIEIAPGDPGYPSGTGDLSWEFLTSSRTAIVYWNGVEIGRDTAASNWSSWAGTNAGRYGGTNSGIVGGANSSNFNGTLNSSLSYYNSIPFYAFTDLADQSGAGNGLTVSTGLGEFAIGALNGLDGFSIEDGENYAVANTTDINDGNRSVFTRNFVFKTDSDVTTQQILYKEGGGTNGYNVYVEGDDLYVGFYNSGSRVYRQFDVTGDTEYILTSTFDASLDEFTVTLNGETMTGSALGMGTDFFSHTGGIYFGASDISLRIADGSTVTPTNTISTIGEARFYDAYLNSNATEIFVQNQALKYDLELVGGTGANEAARATASDGFGAFTTRYLERLAETADITLQATDTITLDLKGDTLDFTSGAAAGKSLSLITTNGDITDVSSGTISTTRTGVGAGQLGNITISAGGNIDLGTTELDAQSGGLVSLSAVGDVDLVQAGALNLGAVSGSNVTIQTTGGTADITLNNIVTSSAAGNSLVLASGRNFTNNFGAGALDAQNASGRFLVYSADPASDNRGGQTYDFKRYNRTYAGNAPATITGVGDGFIYSFAPTLTVTANDVTREYGDANALSYTITDFIDGDTAATTGAVSGSAALSTTANATSNAGTMHTITPTIGTLASDMGYQFTTFNNGTLTVNQATLSVKANNQSITQGASATPTYVFTGFKNSETLATSGVTGAADHLLGSLSALSVGSYTFDLDLSGLTSTNYTFTETLPKGTLTVNSSIPPPPPGGFVIPGPGGSGSDGDSGAVVLTRSPFRMLPEKDTDIDTLNAKEAISKVAVRTKKSRRAGQNNLIVVEKPIIDFYNLCQFSSEYCQ